MVVSDESWFFQIDNVINKKIICKRRIAGAYIVYFAISLNKILFIVPLNKSVNE